MAVIKKRGKLTINITEGPSTIRHKPSVDYLFDSVAKCAGNFNVAAALLTGMGNDGAKGLLQLKKKGAYTVVQNEDSCVVFGMPREAIALNAYCQIAPLQSLTSFLLASFNKKKTSAA